MFFWVFLDIQRLSWRLRSGRESGCCRPHALLVEAHCCDTSQACCSMMLGVVGHPAHGRRLGKAAVAERAVAQCGPMRGAGPPWCSAQAAPSKAPQSHKQAKASEQWSGEWLRVEASVQGTCLLVVGPARHSRKPPDSLGSAMSSCR